MFKFNVIHWLQNKDRIPVHICEMIFSKRIYQDLDLLCHMPWFLCLFLFNGLWWEAVVSFCWFWWNAWTSLFKISFHKPTISKIHKWLKLDIQDDLFLFWHGIFLLSQFRPSTIFLYSSWDCSRYTYTCKKQLVKIILTNFIT